jgi:hypothetical protein
MGGLESQDDDLFFLALLKILFGIEAAVLFIIAILDQSLFENSCNACLIFIKNSPSVCRNRRGVVCHNESQICHNCNEKLLQRKRFLLFPVVPDVLDIVIIFHDVDELFHQGHMLGAFQLLVVLGNHFDLSGKTLEIVGYFELFDSVPYKMAMMNFF